MDPSHYGPFANVVAIAGALVAVFSILLLKMLGGIKRWTWLASDSPPFLVTAGARVLAVALMAATYVTIDTSNYRWFGAAAVISGVFGFISVIRFDRLRKLHVVSIPLVGLNGASLQDKRGAPLVNNVVIGSESWLRPEAAAALKLARASEGVSLRQFMSGYGDPVNDPEALWERGGLVRIANKLTTSLMYVILLAVMTVFLAAFVIEVGGRSPDPSRATTDLAVEGDGCYRRSGAVALEILHPPQAEDCGIPSRFLDSALIYQGYRTHWRES